ncbi:MAG: amidohydrolase [Sedimentibacter sp.]
MITLFKNGNIHTMENISSKTDAFVVDNNKFVYVGSENGAREYLYNNKYEFNEVDLGSQLVLPGFNDSHMHFIHYAKSIRSVNLVGAKSIKEVKERLISRLKERESNDKSWLEGEGWNQDYFKDERRFPNKFDLDDITGDVPTIIMRTCFHIGVLNSAAMKIVNLNKETAKKYGSLVELLPDGEPNGVIKENLLDITKANISTLNLETLKAIINDAQYIALAQGLTSVQTDDIGNTQDNNYDMLFQSFRELDEEGKLNIRIGEQCLLQTTSEIQKFFDKGYKFGYGDHKYRINCIKIISDGSLGARTAAMRKPYNDDPSTKGIELFTQDELNELVLISHKNNCPVAIHGIGDKAIEMSLDAIEYAKTQDPTHNPRHGIVHCQITDEELLNRFKKLQVLAIIQPIFIDYDMNIVKERVGNELAETSYAWQTMIDKGIHASFGTDCPVEPFNTMPNIYSAVTRKSIIGDEKKIYLPNEKMSMYEAIKAYTIEGAYASGEENIKGTISTSKLADFIVLDKDLFNLEDEEEILNTHVIQTYVNGKNVTAQ